MEQVENSIPSKIPRAPGKRPSRKAYLLITLFALLLVLFPFLFWHGTWFGRRLTDAEIERYVSDATKPRQAQHALVQMGERIGRGDVSVRRWYPQVIELSSSPAIELRQTAAWFMGQDHSYETFRAALHRLLGDNSPMVRRNAALSLANFHDEAALPEIRAMLRSSTVQSPVAGVVRYRLKEGEYVNPGTLIARVVNVEVRSQLPGEVRSLRKANGSQVIAGDALVDLGVDKEHAWEALRALYILGEPQDLDDVQRFARGVTGMPDKLRQQAALTAQAIQSRAAIH